MTSVTVDVNSWTRIVHHFSLNLPSEIDAELMLAVFEPFDLFHGP